MGATLDSDMGIKALLGLGPTITYEGIFLVSGAVFP